MGRNWFFPFKEAYFSAYPLQGKEAISLRMSWARREGHSPGVVSSTRALDKLLKLCYTAPEASPGNIQGVLDLLSLSLSCERASWQVYQNFKPTDSGVEDIRALERDLFLFRPLILLPATCARLRTLLIIQARQEKRGVCMWFNTGVFYPQPFAVEPIHSSVVNVLPFYSACSTGNRKPLGIFFIPALQDGAF
jgi:hypothetical protein